MNVRNNYGLYVLAVPYVKCSYTLTQLYLSGMGIGHEMMKFETETLNSRDRDIGLLPAKMRPWRDFVTARDVTET